MMSTIWLRATASAGLILLLTAGSAAAQSTGYGAAQGVSGAPGGGVGVSSSGGPTAAELPFTGLDVTLVLIAGGILLLLGLGLARANRGSAPRR